MKTIHKIPLAMIVLIGLKVNGQNNLILNPAVQVPINDSTPFFEGLVDDRTPKSYFYQSGWQTISAGHQDGLDDWECRLKTKTKIVTASGQLPVKADFILHSPEWYMTNSYTQNSTALSKFRVIEDGVDIPPHSGIGYMGMGPGELVQQKFPNSNDFEEGESYTLNFYIRPISNQNSFATSDKIGTAGYGGDWSDGLDLKVYLRKNKMKYSTSANKFKNRCDASKYYDKKSMSNTITLINTHIDLSSHPTGQWYPVTVEFTAPPSSYDWIVFETQSTKLCESPYILLDDFMLAKSCEIPGCDRTAGYVYPNHNGIVSYTVPLTITNLNNAQSATVEVLTYPGQIPIWSYSVSCTNGIQDPIYWDGRNFGGAYVANAAYLLKVTSTSDCGTEAKTSVFVKNGDYSPAITNNIVCNTSQVETPLPCCEYEPDIVVDNVVLPGPGLLDYWVTNKITVAPFGNVTVTSNADVEMRAGYEIEIKPGFSVDPGGHYLAEIVPCPKSGRLRPSNVDPLPFSVEKEEALVVSSSNEERVSGATFEEFTVQGLLVSVFPTPSTDGKFNVQVANQSAQSYIEVMNLMGVLIQSKRIGGTTQTTIDVSEFPKGIYLIRVVDGENSVTKKVIYH